MSASAAAERTLSLAELNALGEVAALETLLRCCGSRAWASGVVADRPFKDFAALVASADRNWLHATDEERLEAFAQHPRIGARLQTATAGWASGEQRGVKTASEVTLSELTRLNHEYEKRFPHVFLICATGKSADEMLAALKKRLLNTPAEELANAATEQAKITRLRLEKLIK